jgi:hypothetical protein
LQLTQFLTLKRDRTQFLTPKLEELYLLLNELSEDNVNFFKLIVRCVAGDADAKKEVDEIDELDLYGHRKAKKIIMYIRLYFPNMSRIHQMLFAAQRDFNQLIASLHSDVPVELLDIVDACGRISHFLRLMEAVIINNRDVMLPDRILPRKYLPTSDQDIENELPPP